MYFSKRLTGKRILSLGLASIMMGFSSGNINIAFAMKDESMQFITENALNAKIISGFKLSREIKEGERSLLIYEHEKTGAHVVIDKNNNIEKHFEIVFRTPTENNKGTNHVIEHCICNGSEKFPLKNMLTVELSKMSYSEFMNAMTAPNYTTYPISSYDGDELNSLAQVYVDSVFKPNFRTDERIFKKEGVRYSLDQGGKLVVNGTVLNEMCRPGINDSKTESGMISSGTQNEFLPGGIPVDIMDLTYQEVCDTYDKYYHPSNSLIFMSGDIDFEKILTWVDKDYLSKYEKKDMKDVVKYSNLDFNACEKFSVMNRYKDYKEDSEKLYTASVIYNLKEISFEEKIKFNKINELLCSDDEVIRNLKSLGYKVISASIDEYNYNQKLVIELISDNEELMKEEKVNDAISKILSINLTQEKIKVNKQNVDMDRKKSKNNKIYDESLNSNSFINSFVHYNNPYDEKIFSEKYNPLKYKCEEEHIELDANDLNRIIGEIRSKDKKVIIKKDSNDENLNPRKLLEDKLKGKECDKYNLTKNFEAQDEWASQPNDPKEIEKLREHFKRFSQISVPKIESTVEKSEFMNKPLYLSNLDIKDHTECLLSFKTNHLLKEQIVYFILFSQFLDSKYNNEEFEVKKSGKLKSNYSFDLKTDKDKKHNGVFTVDFTTSKEHLEDSMKLLKEEIFDEKIFSVEHIKNSIDTVMVTLNLRLPKKLHNIISRMFLYTSDECYTMPFGLLYHLDKLQDIRNNIDNEDYINKLKDECKKVRDLVINPSALYSSGIIASKDNNEKVKESIKLFLNSIKKNNNIEKKELEINFPEYKKNALIDKNSDHNMAYSIIKLDKTDVVTKVLCQIVNRYFLVPKVREENGAYVVSMSLKEKSNIIVMNSIFDPTPEKSLEVFKKVPDFIEKMELSQDEIDDICKTLIETSDQKIDVAVKQLESYMFNQEDYCEKFNERNEKLKSISLKDLKSYAPILREAMKKAAVILITHNNIDGIKQEFDQVEDCSK